MTDKKVLTNYVRLMTQALVEAGVKAVVISPGSRSTPLAYAFASTKELQVYTQIDERSAGYFALGLTKASGDPVVLLCTSGTAASNYFPAITEAHYARLPLVVITADRPHELREVGAPQAIDQIRMYGNHVKFSVDFPLAEDNCDIDEYIVRHVQRGLSTALTAPIGPIHFNVPFREPLLIDFEMEASPTTFIKHFMMTSSLDEATTEKIRTVLEESATGLIIVGELPIGFNREAFWRFAQALNWPVLCDPLSNLRSQVPEDCKALCIDQYDALLKNESFVQQVIPETVIRFGTQPVSKSLSLYLKKSRPTTFIAVDESAAFRDSLGVVTHHIQSSAEAVLPIIVPKAQTIQTEKWMDANQIASSVIEEMAQVAGDEGSYAHMLFRHLPDGSDLISGSSMPIRDVDTFFGQTDKEVTLFANRGTNGIDGVVSTAIGVQASRQRPTWLLIGDLSFLHDINGLIATRFHKTDLTIVIMNNDGGGIFSYLPQATNEHHFEELFGTPTGLTFDHIAKMYDAQYQQVHTVAEFESELAQEKQKTIRIIEVFTDRQANVKAHRALWDEITRRITSND